MAQRHLDESDFKSRPGRRNTRPRSKIRPAHANAVPGLVTGVDRGRYTVLVGENLTDERTVTAMKARELSKDRVVCGDQVEMVGDLSGNTGSLARIVRISERKTLLRRTADDTDPYERIIVANANQLVIVTALANPEPRMRMIDRCVVAAYDAGMDVVLCLTKADLASPDEFIDLYETIGVKVIVTRFDESGDITPLPVVQDVLAGKMSVFVGHSGVGKSTLVNALVPDAHRSTGVVNAVTGRGRQTSTSAQALRLPQHDGQRGWVIDTPGVRSFGLAHIEIGRILASFDDLEPLLDSCPRGCTHLQNAPDCALDIWVAHANDDQFPNEDPHVLATRIKRIESLRRLITARADASPF